LFAVLHSFYTLLRRLLLRGFLFRLPHAGKQGDEIEQFNPELLGQLLPSLAIMLQFLVTEAGKPFHHCDELLTGAGDGVDAWIFQVVRNTYTLAKYLARKSSNAPLSAASFCCWRCNELTPSSIKRCSVSLLILR